MKALCLSNPNRLPSPLPPSPGGSPVPPRVRPRLGPAHDVFSLEGPGRLAAVPPSGLDPLGTLGFLGRVTSWIRHRPTTSATCHDPRTRPRIPIPACNSADTLANADRHRTGAHPAQRGAAGCQRTEEAERCSRPRSTEITRAPFVVVLRFREPGGVLAASLDDLGLACLTVARTTM